MFMLPRIVRVYSEDFKFFTDIPLPNDHQEMKAIRARKTFVGCPNISKLHIYNDLFMI